jgi:hypothetical protein
MARAARGGGSDIPAEHLARSSSPASRRVLRAAGGEGARVHPHYQDRHEEYVLVIRDDLREIRSLGWLQQSLFGVGTFFFSGAFWLMIELMAHQERFEFTAWMGECVLSVLFGIVLAVVGLVLFTLRQRRLSKYFNQQVAVTN